MTTNAKALGPVGAGSDPRKRCPVEPEEFPEKVTAGKVPLNPVVEYTGDADPGSRVAICEFWRSVHVVTAPAV